MAGWSVSLHLLAVLGISVYAEHRAVHPEAFNGAASRIVSGWEASPGQFPYQLSLRMVNSAGGVSACGGSIIHESWGLTAAHCTALRTTFVIRAGAVNLTRPAIIFETTEYYNHPEYIEILQSIVQRNDIGLLKFPIKLSFNALIQPIRIQRDEDKNRNYNGIRLVAAGWGRTWTNGESPENMNWVYLNGVSNEFCLISYGFSSIIADSTICASGYNVTSQSTCQGDSGGTLVDEEEDGIRTLVGVTSFVSGTGCHTNFPAGFIRPGHYHDWYRQVTGIDFDWEPTPPTTATPTTTTDAPTTVEVTDAPTTVKVTDAPTTVEVTDAPTTVEVTDAPTTSEETDAPTNPEVPDIDATGEFR